MIKSGNKAYTTEQAQDTKRLALTAIIDTTGHDLLKEVLKSLDQPL